MTGNEIRHRAHLEIDCPPGVLVLGNQGRILQVLINLLTNAAHAIEPGFSESNSIRVSVQRREGSVLLEVTDTGSGIDSDVADRIFEPFVTTKGVGFGMGMGLSITRNVLQAMGGTIEVRYSSPEGTTFAVTLQPHEDQSEGSELAMVGTVAEERQAARLKILVVDDEERVLNYLGSLLSHHDVILESDGRRAIDRISGGDIDIVLCDLMMPRMTGMEIHGELKGSNPDASERMLFMTGGVFVEEAADFLAGLPGRWIEKPINIGELESRIWSRIEALEKADRPAAKASSSGSG
jgi:CheY-like chemotaxis protein